MTSNENGVQRDRNPGGDRFLTWTAAAACIVVMVWMSVGWDFVRARESYTGRKVDYYSSLVHGFISGHLYMEKEAEPGLASPDPAVRAKTPFVLDASYYKGRYYLYFGAVPAAFFLLPYSWITGGDLDPRFVVILSAALGFLFSVGILRMAMRDHFARLKVWFQVTLVSILAFTTAIPSLLTRAMFYEVAIATGFALTMAGAFWTYRAVTARGNSILQLALASISFGLAVGCRPNLLLNMPVLAAAALIVARRAKDGPQFRLVLRRAGAAAVIPAAIAGALLAAYNYERFGNPLEFGMTHSMNDFMVGGKQLVSLAFLWPNVHWYYFTLPAFSPFFPYIFPEQAYFGPLGYRWGEAIHGQLPVGILGTYVTIAAIISWPRLHIGRLSAYLGFLAWMFLAPFLAISAIGVRADRYMVDFQPALVLGVVLLAGLIDSVSQNGMLWRAGFAILALLSVGFNIFAGIQEFEVFKNVRISTFQTLQSLGDYPAYWLEKIGVLRAGPIELKVLFPTHPHALAIEPLLVAGTPEYTDALYVIEWPPGDQIEFMGDHSGFGGPRSGAISITPGQPYTLGIDIGALYPPSCPPFTEDFRASRTRLLKNWIRVKMGNKTVLDSRMSSYDAPPWSIEMGRNDITMNPYNTDFSGRILSAVRLPPERLLENKGLWRLRCVFPLEHPNMAFPLVSVGHTGSGKLIYIIVLPDNQIRFSLDEWGFGGAKSDAFKVAPDSKHVVEIFFGPLAKEAERPREWDSSTAPLKSFKQRLSIWLDGHLVLRTLLKQPFDPLDSPVDLGKNRQGFSTAQEYYSGSMQTEPYTLGEAREFLDRNLNSER